MANKRIRKLNFSSMKIETAMALIGAKNIQSWNLSAPPHAPSDLLTRNLQRFQRFDTVGTEAAKLLLADAILVEAIEPYHALKVWKGAELESPTMKGFADYLITPDYVFVSTPLLCAAEAKRDNFVQGRAQCVAEMAACREKNQADGYNTDIFGFVTNGKTWQFYKYTTAGEVFETSEYSLNALPELLGALDYICGECAKRVP